MRRLLLLACGISSVAIAGEVWSGAGQANAPALLAPRPADPAAQRAPSAEPASDSVDQWVTAALARPLFAADRRPVPGFTSSQMGLPRLSGVIASPMDKVAIFEAEGAAKPVSAHNGDTVGGWLITMIEANVVMMRKGNSSMVLRPEFGTPGSKPKVKEIADTSSRWVTAAASGILRDRWSNPQLQP